MDADDEKGKRMYAFYSPGHLSGSISDVLVWYSSYRAHWSHTMSSYIYNRSFSHVNVATFPLIQSPHPPIHFFLTLPPIALRVHSSRDFGESSNVAPSNQTWELSLGWLDVLLCGLETVLEA